MRNLFLKKRICNLACCVLFALCVHSQNVEPDSIKANKTEQSIFELELKGVEYEKLQLIVFDNNFKVGVINGTKTDIYHWKFTYPDSLYQTNTYMQLFIPTGDKMKLHIANLNLLSQQGDTIKRGGFNISPNRKYRAFKYAQKTVKSFQFYGGKDVTFDNFIVSEENLSDFSLGALSPFRMIDKTDTLNYQSDLERFVTLVKENNNSHFLLSRLRTSLLYIDSKEDVALVYTLFSDEMKKSTFGKQIKQYLAAKEFVNMKLANSDSGMDESILSNNHNYALVVFSASWCGPCHKQIPLLKKVYKDLSPSVEFVYISVDEAKTVEGWKQVVRDESIPWRSLLASDQLEKVKSTYFVESIPFSYLVYPDKTFETIDIRQEVDRRKLYGLCNHPMTD